MNFREYGLIVIMALGFCALSTMAGSTLPGSGDCQVGSDIHGEAEIDFSGWSVDISGSGNRLAVGGIGNDGETGEDSGHVRVYEYQGGGWVQLGSDIDGETEGDRFGYSIAISSDGNRIAVGTIYNHGNGDWAGHARVYEYQDNEWVQLGADIDGEAANDESGKSVDLSGDGNRIAVGATHNDDNGFNAGHVRVYEYQNDGWVQVGSDIDGEAGGDQFGLSLSISNGGDRIAVGAPSNLNGYARVYEYQDSEWVQLGSDIDGEAIYDSFGYSIAISDNGNRIVVGANFNDGNGDSSGHARIYEYQASEWVQLGSDIDGEAEGDEFGHSVVISSDGDRIGVGARWNDGNGGCDTGHARIYEYQDDEWVQVGSDIEGDDVLNQLGYSIAMSGDGNRIAVGAPYSSGNGDRSGLVRVFSPPC